jgi:hypothetical protein
MATYKTDELTNEERCVKIYNSMGEPTIPNNVSPKTSLSKLNLNWRERDLPEGTDKAHPSLAPVFRQVYSTVSCDIFAEVF